MKTSTIAKLAGLALCIWTLGACATVPHTGRSQLSLVSDAEMEVAAERNYKSFMRRNGDRVVSSSESPQAARLINEVQEVSRKIIDSSGLRGRFAWETVVVRSKEANAFVMPNGKIVVFTGLLPIVKDEHGLAAVLGHEVAHVIGRHSAERMSQQVLASFGMNAASIAGQLVGMSNPKYAQPAAIGATLTGVGAQYLFLLPYSRSHESEADRIGLILSAKAGYNPEAAIGVWERMEARNGSGPWEFSSTHPNPSTRIQQIREYLPEARRQAAIGSGR